MRDSSYRRMTVTVLTLCLVCTCLFSLAQAAKVWQYQLDGPSIDACQTESFDDLELPFVCVSEDTNEIDQTANDMCDGESKPTIPLAAEHCVTYAYNADANDCKDLFAYGDNGWDLSAPQCYAWLGVSDPVPVPGPCVLSEIGYNLYKPDPAFSPAKAEQICIVYEGETAPADDDCTAAKSPGACKLLGQGGEDFKYTLDGSTPLSASDAHCMQLEEIAIYSFEGRAECTGTIAWDQVCTANYAVTPNTFLTTDKIVKCFLKRGEDDNVELTDKFCQVNVEGDKPTPQLCTVQDIPTDDFVSENNFSCVDVFSTDLLGTTEETARCLVKSNVGGTDYQHYITKEAGMTCAAKTLGSCSTRAFKFAAADDCTSPIQQYYRLDGTGVGGVAEILLDHLGTPSEEITPADYKSLVQSQAAGTACVEANYKNAGVCNGQWDNTNRNFGGKKNCGWLNPDTSVLVLADAKFCEGLFGVAADCTLASLDADGARVGTCADLFAEDLSADPATPKSRGCYVLGDDAKWHEVIEADGTLPAVCASPDPATYTPTQCASPEFVDDTSCTTLDITVTCYVVDTNKEKQFATTAPCASDLQTKLFERVQACQAAHPDGYVRTNEVLSCDYDVDNESFKAGFNTVSSDCQRDAVQVRAEFCSQKVSNDAQLFEDVDTTTNKVTRSCELKDVLVWKNSCNDIFTGATVVYKAGEYGPVCAFTDKDGEDHALDSDALCLAEIADSKLPGKTISDCGATFSDGGFDGTIDCKSETAAVAEVATCKVNGVLIVKDGVDGAHDFTACKTDYDNIVFKSASCDGTYQYVDVCKADPTEEGFDNIPLTPTCQYNGEDALDYFCEVRGETPNASPAKCSYATLPESVFVPLADIKCTDLFTVNDNSNTPNRCLVKSPTSDQTSAVDASVAGNPACTARSKSLIGDCIDRVVTPANGQSACYQIPSVAVTLKDVESGSAVMPNMLNPLDEDFDYSQDHFGGACNAELLTNAESNCDGKYLDDDQKFGSANTCAYNGNSADARFCETNKEAVVTSCQLKYLTADASRPSTCAELFPKGENDKAVSNGNAAKPELCMVKTLSDEWIPVDLTGLDPADYPAGCQSLGTKSPSQCIEVGYQGAGTCSRLEIGTVACKVMGTSYEWDDASLCDAAVTAERIARVKAEGCEGTYTTALAENGNDDCTWDKNANSFDPSKKAKYDCKYDNVEADPEFCSATKDDPTPTFADVADGKVLKDCELKDFVQWSSACADVFKTLNKIVSGTSYHEVCRANVKTETIYPGDEVCALNSPKSDNIVTFDTCTGDAPEFVFTAPTTTEGAQIDCRDYANTDLTGTDATCTVFGTPIVDDEDKPDFAHCESLTTYKNYLLNSEACSTDKYEWSYDCSEDIAVVSVEEFKNGVTTTTCLYDKQSASDDFCNERLSAPNTNNGENCKIADIPASRFVTNPACDVAFNGEYSDPTASHCVVMSKSMTNPKHLQTGGDDTNPACENNKKVLGDCLEKKVIVDETSPCTAPITRVCVLKGSITEVHPALQNDCDPLAAGDWAYTADHFAGKGCVAADLSVIDTRCDGRFLNVDDGFEAGATTCAYGETNPVDAKPEFCNNNGKPGAATCDLTKLTAEGASNLVCAELYPDAGEGFVASNDDVPSKCFVKTTNQQWIPITQEQASSFGGLPTQCTTIPDETRASCTKIQTPSSPSCTDIALSGAVCVVAGTEVQFSNASNDETCKVALSTLRKERTQELAVSCVTEGNAYAAKTPEGSQCFANVDGDAPEPGYLSTRTAEPEAAGANRLCFYGPAGAEDQPASIEFCSKDENFSDIVDDGENPPYLPGSCELADCGLAFKTGTCGLLAEGVSVLYTACEVRVADGSLVEVDPTICIDNLPGQSHKFACATTQVQWINRAEEIQCTNDPEPSEQSVEPDLYCAVQTSDNKWYVMQGSNDENVHSSYYSRCEALPAPEPVKDTPSPCVATAKWTAPECTGTPAERVFTCDGAADAVCADVLGDLGKDVPRCYASEPDYYDWYAKPTGERTDCATVPITWQCKKTTALRLKRQPLDPQAVKIRYTDSDLDSAETVDDNTKCGDQPEATAWPCSCSTGAVSADALVYPADPDTLYFDEPANGITSRTPQCLDDHECPQLDVVILAQSAVSPVYRSKNEALDHKTCDPTTGKIAGTGSTRACQSQADSGVFWTRDLGAFNDENSCTAPCNIQGHAVTKWAFSCARRVVTDSGDVKVVLIPDTECTAAGKPRPNPPACNQHACVRDYNWVVGPWTLADSTKTKAELCSASYSVTRSVVCRNSHTGEAVDDSLCGDVAKPEVEDEHDPDDCGESAVWLTSAYSACTFSAAGGVASRSVDCIVLAADGKRFVKVPNAQCDSDNVPGPTVSCCLNGGTASATGCKCATGFSGVACELGGGFTLKVPNYQPYDYFRYFIDGATDNEFKGANVELLRVQGNSASLLARLATNADVPASGLLYYGPTSDADDFFGAWLKLRIAAGSTRVESEPFILNRPVLCSNSGEYLFDEKRCQCPSDGILGPGLGGTFCHVDKCAGCDENAGCHIGENGEAASCCEADRRFSAIALKCYTPCSDTSCAHDGVAVLSDEDVCACECTNSWNPESNCQTCDLQCGTNGMSDANCSECVCNRGFTSENGGVCNCRSLVIRLAFKRTKPLTTVERTSLAFDVASILISEGVAPERITVSAGTVQGSRLAVDISIKASSCFPEETSNKDVKSLLASFKLSNWLKLDGEAEEFGALATILSDALSKPDELPSSFQIFEFDATLGASITDPGCETDCMEPVSVGNGGPPLNYEMDGGSDNDDLKWIIPISILIPLAVIVTGVILYVKCKPQVRTTSAGTQNIDQIELEELAE